MLPSTERLIRYERLAAPGEQLGVLVEPPAASIHAGPPAFEGSVAAEVEFPLADWRSALRQELGLDGPVILTGHQPEFLHPGVFAKILAAQSLASRFGGTAVFLTVDTDVPKSATLRVPQVTTAGLRRVDVPVPGIDPQRPYVAQPRTPRDRWVAFFAQQGALIGGVGDTLLGTFAKTWIEDGGPSPEYCDVFGRARRATEAALGMAPLRELRESALARTHAFQAFFAHIAIHARMFAGSYNAAQSAFRKRHKVRAKGRPVPPLRIDQARVELPFWIVPATPGEDGRMRLFVAWAGKRATFYAEDRPAFETDRAALEAGGALVRAGWSIWPRALTLSTFARLLFADLFIHGIGGAKYDEVSEDFARDFFGFRLAPMCCVTATLQLPLPHSSLSITELRGARRASRDLRYNPQRYVRSVPQDLLARRLELIRHSEELRAQRSKDRDERRVVFREIRRVNAQILDADPWCAAHHDQRIEAIEAQLALDRVALEREYFYALHPVQTLRAMRDKLDAACRVQ